MLQYGCLMVTYRTTKKLTYVGLGLGIYVTVSNISAISWWSVLLVEETGVPGENRPLSQVTDKLDHIMWY